MQKQHKSDYEFFHTASSFLNGQVFKKKASRQNQLSKGLQAASMMIQLTRCYGLPELGPSS